MANRASAAEGSGDAAAWARTTKGSVSRAHSTTPSAVSGPAPRPDAEAWDLLAAGIAAGVRRLRAVAPAGGALVPDVPGTPDGPLDSIYPTPRDWFLHEGATLRFLHLDLQSMTEGELRMELRRLRLRLTLDRAPDHWLPERYQMLEAELRRRGGDGGGRDAAT